MLKLKKNILFLGLLLGPFCFSQNKSISIRYFVTENSVLLRWAPSDLSAFNIGVKNGYRLTRYKKENNTLTSPVVVAENLMPYAYNDSLTWGRLIRKNEKAAFAFQSLYGNRISGNTPQKKKEEQAKMLYGLMLLSCDFDSSIAKACGLYFKDNTISRDNLYSYKIEINNLPATENIPPVVSEVNTCILSNNPEIKNLTSTFKNKVVRLEWKSTDFTNQYAAYNIECSSDSIEFKKINNAPVLLLTSQFEKRKDHISYSDTLSKDKVKYYYRIKGINFFGAESNPSNIVSGMGYDELKSMPFIDSIKVITNSKVFLHWKMGEEKENNLLREYILTRSESDNGKYEIIHRSNAGLSFIDNTPKQSNYYKVGAITYRNDTLFSFSKLALIPDTIPPAVPSGLNAKTDTKGNVTITWNKNPESDIKGYKIYKSNALTEEFVQINKEFANDPEYKDRLILNTLSKKVYYSVAATDNNFNSSELSKPIEVKRPDTIPPVPALITDLQITLKGIKVSWSPSISDDVKQYIMYHEDEGKKSLVKIKAWGPVDSATTHLDTVVECGNYYQYKIITMDEDDNISVSNIPYMFFETGFRKKITAIKALTDRTKRSITLTWDYRENKIEKFIIYRAKAKESLTIIKTLEFPASSFDDNTLNIGNTYEYRIKAVFTNGAESIISDGILIEY